MSERYNTTAYLKKGDRVSFIPSAKALNNLGLVISDNITGETLYAHDME